MKSTATAGRNGCVVQRGGSGMSNGEEEDDVCRVLGAFEVEYSANWDC